MARPTSKRSYTNPLLESIKHSPAIKGPGLGAAAALGRTSDAIKMMVRLPKGGKSGKIKKAGGPQ